MSDARITIEEAQAEIDGLLVAEICRDFGINFHGVYPDYILARGVGPEQAFIGLAIKRGHLATAAEITRLRAQVAAADGLAEAATAIADETCDYMKINHLGDGEQKHNVKWVRAALATYQQAKEGGE